MRSSLKILLALFSIVLLLAVMTLAALYVPNSLHTNSDFLAIYDADLRLLQHIEPYDYQGQIHQIAERTGTLPENVYVPRFPYPPWYALSTFYLGLLPIQSAALLWFEINLIMLFLTVWFLSADWHPRLRLFSFLAPFFFIPVIGTLGVGQYGFPVLLGTSILAYALKHKQAAYTLPAFVLLTFKPHIGVPILLTGLIYMLYSRNTFDRRIFPWILGTGALLFSIGYFTDPQWPSHYMLSLLSYRNDANITTCSECDSLPVWLARTFIHNPGFAQMALIGLGLFLLFILLCIFIRPLIWKSTEYLLTTSVLIVLLAIPYLYNYDFILLLIPFAVLVEKSSSWLERIGLIILYLLPFVLIGAWGRAGNPSLLLVTLILAILVFLHTKNPVQLDVSLRSA
jgi:hypothetical protein